MSHERRRRLLPFAATLGAAQASWSIFLWRELLRLRSGADVVCVGGGDGCGDAWNSPFASAVQVWTGLPVAAWGVVWGLVAAGLAVWAWWRLAADRPHGAALGALQLTALAGVATVAVLAGSLALAGQFCGSCAITYALVIAYAAVALIGTGLPARSHWLSGTGLPARSHWLSGAGLAAGATAAAWLALLYPGLQTPPSSEATVASVERGDDLARWLDQLPATARQGISDTIAAYAATRGATPDPDIPVLGSETAPVRITDFSDILCSHCKQLHDVLERLRQIVPPDQLALQARHFPLDGSCNAQIGRSVNPTRCAAARALICIPDPAAAFDVAGAMFRDPALSESRVVELASRARGRSELEACMASPQTEARLARDVARASEFDIHGTPLVLVNDRRAFAYPPFLFALALAGGDTDHPAFATLPPAQPIPEHDHAH